jgi:hypothetical protein
MNKPNVVTEHVLPPIPDRSFDWSAHDDNSYDGAPDAGRRNHIIGRGATEQEAIADFWKQWEELCESR